jgi:DNA-3-methyladenine glycosylase
VSGERDWRPLPRRFYRRPVVELAAALIGTVLVRRRGRTLLAGRIVETEAYGGEGVDPSAHSFRGRTPRCAVMFGPAGHAYVYTTHQGRCCLNVTAEGDRRGKAVLIRALEPLSGLQAMRALRLAALDDGPTRARLLGGRADHELAAGPGRLCLGLDIDRALNGVDLTARNALLWIAAGPTPRAGDAKPAARIGWTSRIGLNPKSGSFGWSWRAVELGSRAVSGSTPRRARRSARPAACPEPPRGRRPAR